ncbi:MAG: hypothetical protein D6808_07870 [Candidatus Dadabacteria bacterium]|nr:MAG: hypothetical protein D6808_07870 [Candidatus Dadabacteria bacterium]
MAKVIIKRVKKFSWDLIQETRHFLPMLLAVLAIGCGYTHTSREYVPVSIALFEHRGEGSFKTAYIADQIDYYYRGTSTGPIGVTTIVNLNDLYATSAFGRVFAEQLMSELVVRGYDVVEMRQADALHFLNNAGEFALSRDVAAVSRAQDLAAILAGTYVASPSRVYVNVRLIDPATSVILSSGTVELPKTKEIAKLLRGGTMPSSLERIPVKHLAQNTYPLILVPGYRLNRYDLEEYGVYPPIRRPVEKDDWNADKKEDSKDKREGKGDEHKIDPLSAINPKLEELVK